MKYRLAFVASLVACLFMILIGVAFSPPAGAHNIEGRQNIVINDINSAGDLGIIDHFYGPTYSYTIPRGWDTKPAIDVDGFYVGGNARAELWQSNDGVHWGRYGVIAGPVRFKTDYWLWNKVIWYPVRW